MRKNNFFVMTGGPGGGKTTLLERLKIMGVPFVPEVARALISERLRNNLPPRPEPFEFALNLLERDIGNFLRHSDEDSIRFFDRSFIDSAGMLYGYAQIQSYLCSVLKEHRFNSRVFITPPWKEIYCNDEERDQTFEDAERVFEELYQWYSANGYEILILPKDTAEARAEFVTEALSL